MGGSEDDSRFTGSNSCSSDLRTKRLHLRRPQMADAGAIVALANNPEIARWLSRMPHPYHHAHAADWIAEANTSAPAGCTFLITLAETGEIIGACGFGAMPDVDLPQIGYWIGEPHWGNGYATEAVQLLIDHVFATFDIDTIGSACRVANVASRRVIEKCGFQYSGLDMMDSRFEGVVVPVFAFRMTRRIWESLKSWAAA